MYSYIPKLHHAMITALICIILIAMGGKAQGRTLLALNIGAFIFAVMTATVLWMLIVENQAHVIDSMSRFAEALFKLDDEGRAALAFQFPAMRYRMRRGQPRPFFEDTNITIDQFRLFLGSSNSKYISPERDWTTTEKPRAAWVELRDWLEVNEYIIPDSAAGSHSWLWSGGSYDRLMAYWLAGRQLKNLNEMETV